MDLGIKVKSNPILTKEDWLAMRKAAEQDPENFTVKSPKGKFTGMMRKQIHG